MCPPAGRDNRSQDRRAAAKTEGQDCPSAYGGSGKTIVDAALLHDRIGGMAGFDFRIHREMRSGDRAEPDVMAPLPRRTKEQPFSRRMSRTFFSYSATMRGSSRIARF